VKRRSTFLIGSLYFGYAFLYLPIALLIAYSFNDSRIPTVWGGFSLRWYAALLENEQVIDARY
jgi:putrescine transport system permease protein